MKVMGSWSRSPLTHGASIRTRQTKQVLTSVELNEQRPCCWYANQLNKERRMQVDLREFLSRLVGAVALTLLPVLLIAFVAMPASLHHHLGNQPADQNAPIAHMT
jgi:hypothetical protein